MSYLTGNVKQITKQPSILRMTFEMNTTTVIDNSTIYHYGKKQVDPDGLGDFSVELAPGDYKVYAGEYYVGLVSIPGPANDTTYTFAQRLVSSTVYTPTTPAGGNQPNASSTVLGLVKTNSDPGGGADPVVYLKSEVDALVAGGVSVTSIGGVPTMDFSNSDRIHILLADGYVLELGANSGGLIQNVLAP